MARRPHISTPANSSMHDDTPSDLFGHTPPPAQGKKSLKASGVDAKRSPLQREFDRLTGRIEEAQALLAAWKQQPTVILQKYHAKMEPAIRQLTDAQKSLIVQIDALLTSPPKGLRMTARRRSALTDCLLDLIDTVMAHGVDDTLTDIHDRHSDTPIVEIAQEDEAEHEAEIIELFRQTFGKDSIKRDADESHEAFVERARARLFEAMEAEQRREDAERQRRADKRSAKKNAKQRVKTAPTPGNDDDASPRPDLLRTLYRKLASSMHPDRERDAEEKLRKTEAMQDLNTAYQNKDLLSLLKLHNQTLQSDAVTDTLAEDTLREYNALLKAQLKSLESEISRAIDEATPHGIAMMHGRIKRPEQLEHLMDADIRKFARTAESVLETVRDLNDPKLRAGAINDLVEMAEERREMDAFDEIVGEYFR